MLTGGVATLMSAAPTFGQAQPDAALPAGVHAVWDSSAAYRETTPTRERLCINGLWRWQPARGAGDAVPAADWGYFKVPGCWPGITDYMQKDYQTVHAHPTWKGENLSGMAVAWYQREITVPAGWRGRRIALAAEYVNSFAAVCVDGDPAGQVRFPGGEVDLTALCRPGTTQVLSLEVTAMPLKGVMLSFNDTNAAREVKGSVARRGLCGDVWLVSTPAGARLGEVAVATSVRKGEIAIAAGVDGLAAAGRYALRARVSEGDRLLKEFTGTSFTTAAVKDGRIAFTEPWRPDRLWDLHTPEHQCDLRLCLLDDAGRVLDESHPARFGFREFWIDGRDFYLNGTRLFLSAVPLDNAQVGALPASYAGALESLKRLQSFGINFVYTHNYGCEPGAHLGFAEILRAADDAGMLVALSQPHFSAYDWKAPDADAANGYARHAEFYVRVARDHPSVVAYAMSHNATGYADDMNPDLIDGIANPRESWALNNAKLAVRAEAIVSGLDPSRIVYHHSSGNLSSMHTSNFYPNWAPVQELDDWFEHWATQGVKPVFLCEYGAPFGWDWAMYRGWFRGSRSFGSATVPWDYCLAEWNAQFLGDTAFQISEREKTNLRWEARQSRSGNLWHRWDYPYQVGERRVEEMQPVQALYTTHNWRAFRTWGLSANSPWEHARFWMLREGVDKSRKELPVDWDRLQRPGLSPDYVDQQYERMDLAFERTDWVPSPTAEALLRNNLPLLAYIAGKPARFTSKDHLFRAGETVEKQLVVINNSRETVTCECHWQAGLPQPVEGRERVTVPTGDQARIAIRFALSTDLTPGPYRIEARFEFSTGKTQEDAFSFQVLPAPQAPGPLPRTALFDPHGETRKLFGDLQIGYTNVDVSSALADVDLLVVGKGALSLDGAAPDIGRVREGLKVIVFEQTAEALEQRLGFRVAEYGLRQVFARVPDHPVLAGLGPEALRDWRGEATLLPPRLKYTLSPRLSYAPAVTWCGMEVSRVWRCGCRGNVASVLLEKPARGDFLPLVDGGFSLQYSPLLEYREGKGVVLFCQMDVTGRSEPEPVAEMLVRNLMAYAGAWRPGPRRAVVYSGDATGRQHLEATGLAPGTYAGGPLSPEQVLVVAAGSGAQLAGHRAEVATFVKAGGNLLALGLGEEEANALLPSRVAMKVQEHIAAFFEPPGADSLLVGIGPADVHNRDPRELPLLSGGARPIGNGVLAQATDANVVFWQLPPYAVSKAQGVLPSFVVDPAEAVEGRSSALVTLGAATEVGAQFGQKVTGGEPGKRYTFAVLVKGVGGPVALNLEIERAGRPWDRALKAPKVTVPDGEWTELHATFDVDKAYPEGWFAYLSCGQEGGRFRADLFRLYEGDHVPGNAGDDDARTAAPNAFADSSFESGSEAWRFSCGVQYNLRKTYRRSSFVVSRVLANLGAAASTPVLSRFSQPVTSERAERRWLDGLYLDQPEEWDDPYRFFRW
jgi:hypothetical protein